eukprot:TRINITY_DN19564_c0_g1_i2.p1 TRINITY_DN19564_c0_g1~~TRINITY_DN19564_c0_g1_i2.p1  ORF type:complete len:120 (-),score=14.11 TRINITY_DN19564_c0_g1_i2:23-382(-)
MPPVVIVIYLSLFFLFLVLVLVLVAVDVVVVLAAFDLYFPETLPRHVFVLSLRRFAVVIAVVVVVVIFVVVSVVDVVVVGLHRHLLLFSSGSLSSHSVSPELCHFRYCCHTCVRSRLQV